jgi:hypothetical protein
VWENPERASSLLKTCHSFPSVIKQQHQFMADFKFPCPNCKQNIQCDTTYVGSQITCPSCQKTIEVPHVPTMASSGDDSVHLKKSTLRNAALVAAGVLVLAVLVAAGVYVFGGINKLTFKAYVDGTDIVKVSGRKVWIEHLEWQPPNKITVNGKKWNPVWNDNTSGPYLLPWGSHLGNTDKIKFSKRLGRGSINIMERPSPANEETLSIKVDDGPYGGADWYEFTVSW